MLAPQFAKCRCACHNMSGYVVKHIVPCCFKCPYCRERLKTGNEEHVDECKQDHLQRAERVLGRALSDDEKAQFFTSMVWSRE